MTYDVRYAAAWVVFVVGIVAGALAAAGAVGILRPSWLSSDVIATAALVSTICVGLAGALPAIGRTPSKRAAKYLKAAAGYLPEDLAGKHSVEGKPLDTIPH